MSTEDQPLDTEYIKELVDEFAALTNEEDEGLAEHISFVASCKNDPLIYIQNKSNNKSKSSIKNNKSHRLKEKIKDSIKENDQIKNVSTLNKLHLLFRFSLINQDNDGRYSERKIQRIKDCIEDIKLLKRRKNKNIITNNTTVKRFFPPLKIKLPDFFLFSSNKT